MALLGSIVCEPAASLECLDQCIEAGITEQHFYDERNRMIFRAIIKLSKKPIDNIRLWATMRLEKGWPDNEQYVRELSDKTSGAIFIDQYLEIVLARFEDRQLVRTSVLVNALGRGTLPRDEKLDEAERLVLAIRSVQTKRTEKEVEAFIDESAEDLDRWMANQGAAVGITTGFVDIDLKLQGFTNGELIVVAARPSCGKTTWMCQVAENVAVDQRIPVGFFSLEMSGKNLGQRFWYSRAQVDTVKAKFGRLTAEELHRMTVARSVFAGAPLTVQERSGLTIGQIAASARRLKASKGMQLMFVDYLQLVSGDAKGNSNREREVAQISSGLKKISKDLDIPVVVAAQLGREVDRDGRRPRLSDLRESGAIEQDADVVIFLYRPSLPNGDEPEQDDVAPEVMVDVAKNRNGRLGQSEMIFQKDITRFFPKSKIGQADLPPKRNQPQTQQEWPEAKMPYPD